MKFNIEILNKYLEDGYLINQSHPTYPMLIWNYSQKTQYEGFWNEITIACRGLVTDLDGNVIAKGFPKFFNIEEKRHIPTDNFEVWEKLDGQYIGCFWYNGELIVNSRGSFTSPYAIEAKRILEEKYPLFEKLPSGRHLSHAHLTYCFELIGFEQIVVSYSEPDLVLTGKFRNDVLLGWMDLPLRIECDIPIAKKYSGLDYTQIKQLNWQNKEGFVVRFSNGQRCKIKFEDYINLHRQMTNLSTTAIWEALRDGKPVSEILTDVPDEFFVKVREYEEGLKEYFHVIEVVNIAKFDLVKMAMGYDTNNRKKFAELVNLFPDKTILFLMFDWKDYSQQIWKLIKPKYEKI